MAGFIRVEFTGERHSVALEAVTGLRSSVDDGGPLDRTLRRLHVKILQYRDGGITIQGCYVSADDLGVAINGNIRTGVNDGLASGDSVG